MMKLLRKLLGLEKEEVSSVTMYNIDFDYDRHPGMRVMWDNNLIRKIDPENIETVSINMVTGRMLCESIYDDSVILVEKDDGSCYEVPSFMLEIM